MNFVDPYSYQLKGEVISFTSSRLVVTNTLKVWDPENVEAGYNVHTIIRQAPDNRAFIIAEMPYSLNNGDSFLTVVLAFTGSQYATWIYNHQTDSCNYGNYFFGDYEKAMKDFLTRGSFNWKIQEDAADEQPAI